MINIYNVFKGENLYNCNGTNYGQITNTKVIIICNTQACLKLTPRQDISIGGKLVSKKNAGWQKLFKGAQ